MVPPNGPSRRTLDVDVDPLVVVGRVGELVDPVLVDRQPLGGADLLARRRAFDLVETCVKVSLELVGPLEGWRRVPSSPNLRVPRSRRRLAPKVLLHDHLDGGLRPRRSWSSRRGRARAARGATAEALGRLVRRRGQLGLARALPRDLRPHGRCDADRARPSSGSRPSAPRTSLRTASCTRRCGTRPSSTSSAG